MVPPSWWRPNRAPLPSVVRATLVTSRRAFYALCMSLSAEIRAEENDLHSHRPDQR